METLIGIIMGQGLPQISSSSSHQRSYFSERKDQRRVLLFSHYSIIRAGLRHILTHTDSYFFFGEAGEVKDATRKVGEESWDIVILDFSLKGYMILDLIKQLIKQKDGPSILIISPYIEDQNLKRSLSAGASGFLHWDELELHLPKAIEWIGGGEKYIDPKMNSLLLKEEHNQRLPHDCLSDREFQVLCQLSQGKRIADAAYEMTLSPKIIHTYRKRIQEKMKLNTYEEIVRYGRQWLLDKIIATDQCQLNQSSQLK